MGSFSNFDRLCRLCATESQDLIYLFENPNNDRNLVAIIKKYIRVTVNVQDELPHQVCGPCVAKLDEVVDFVDTSVATQTKFRRHLNDNSSSNVRVHEDKIYELIQDVKVELEETDDKVLDDLSDEDYGPKSHRRRTVKTRGMRVRRDGMKGTLGRVVRRPRKNKVLKENDVQSYKDEHKRDEDHKGSEGEKEDIFAEEGFGDEKDVKLEGKAKCPVRCCICEAAFDNLEDLATHSNEAHQLTEIRYMCPQCPQTFLKISSMNSHQRRKHQDSLQSCPKCKKLYPAHYLWTRHMLVHTNTRPFTCDECNKKFKSKAELYNHKKTHRPSEERYTHCCEVCGKRFTQKANLESHLKLHSGNRPFSCEFCGKSFSQRGNMEEHRRIHTGEKPFVCDVCDVRYSRQGQLALHRKKHTGEKPHKCQFCQKEFLRREVLRKHEHIHTDTRPYKCSYCDKSFRDQGKRKVHERLHTGERPFECQFCNRGFCESGNLKKHLRVHQRCAAGISTSAPTVQEIDAHASSLGTGSVIVTSGMPSYSIATDSHSTFTCASSSVSRQNLEVVTNPSLLIVPESSSLVTQGSHLPSNSLPPNDSSLPLQISGPVDISTHTLMTHRPHDEPPPRGEAGEREDEYRVNSSVPFQSVAWALYQT